MNKGRRTGMSQASAPTRERPLHRDSAGAAGSSREETCSRFASCSEFSSIFIDECLSDKDASQGSRESHGLESSTDSWAGKNNICVLLGFTSGVMAWASISKVVLGCLAFAVWWMLAVFPAVRFLPIGRTAGSLLGATLMVVFQVLSPNDAFLAIDLAILALLFGTMVVSIYLQRAGLFHHLGHALSWKTRGAMDVLCRVCLLAALSSALFTNDTTCVFLTGFVLELCKEKKLRPKPFLLALACSANIGSAATPIGNPQNLVIAVNSGISFGRFLAGVLPAMLVGLVVNTLLLVMVYGRTLSLDPVDSTSGQQVALPVAGESERHSRVLETGHVKVYFRILSEDIGNMPNHRDTEQEGLSNRNSLVLSSPRLEAMDREDVAGPYVGNAHDDIIEDSREWVAHGGSEREVRSSGLGHEHGAEPENSRRSSCRANSCDDLESRVGPRVRKRKKRGIFQVFALCTGVVRRSKDAVMFVLLSEKWRKHQQRIWKASVYLVTLGMLAALLGGLSLPWSAITAAVVMMVLDFKDAGPSLDKVSYSLLVFFAGMFIATSGFNATGAPGVFWSAVEPHSKINTASGVAVLSLVVTALSNVVSNVPTVILLGGRVAESAKGGTASSDKAWLILAWVSTVAGNLTLVGSAANIIVCEQARETYTEKELRKNQSNDITGDFQGTGSPGRATYNLSFWSHLKFGFLSTLIVIAVGLFPIVLRKF